MPACDVYFYLSNPRIIQASCLEALVILAAAADVAQLCMLMRLGAKHDGRRKAAAHLSLLENAHLKLLLVHDSILASVSEKAIGLQAVCSCGQAGAWQPAACPEPKLHWRSCNIGRACMSEPQCVQLRLSMLYSHISMADTTAAPSLTHIASLARNSKQMGMSRVRRRARCTAMEMSSW